MDFRSTIKAKDRTILRAGELAREKKEFVTELLKGEGLPVIG